MARPLYLPAVTQLEAARLEVDEYISEHSFKPHSPIHEYARADMCEMMQGITERLQWLGNYGLRLTVAAEAVYFAASGIPFCGKLDVFEDVVATGEYQGVSVTVSTLENGEEHFGLMLNIHGDLDYRGRCFHGSIGARVDGRTNIGIGPAEAMN